MGSSYHSVFIKKDGTVWGTGRNTEGQLGIGNEVNQASPIQLPINDVKQIALGQYHTFFIKKDGTVWATGANNNGQLGIGNIIRQLSPVQVQIADVKEISAGGGHSIFLKIDGTVWGTGAGAFYQLGRGDTSDISTPVKLSIIDVRNLSAGQHYTILIKMDGTVWAAGYNSSGQLGNGNTTTQTSFVQIPITNVKHAKAGVSHTAFLKSDGTVWTTGSNESGQLGTGNTTDLSTPTKALIENVNRITLGGSITFFIKTDGTIWGVGRAVIGQLGTGNTTSQSTPIQLPISDVDQISCGDMHTVVLKKDSTVWVTGRNMEGQIATAGTANQLSFVKMGTENSWKLLTDIFIEIITKYLVKDGEQIKTLLNGSWSVVGTAPVTRLMFDQGMSDTLSLTLATLSLLASASPELLTWTDEAEPIRHVTQDLKDGWYPVSDTLPTEEIFLSEGIDNLMTIPTTAWQLLTGDFDIVTYGSYLKSDPRATMNATPFGQLIVSEVDFSMVEELTVTATDVKLIASGNGGVSWKVYNGAWNTITSDALTVSVNGMTPTVFNAITQDQWKALGSNIRLGYYVEEAGLVNSLSTTGIPVSIETPTLDSVKITYDDITIEGRLKDLELINAINMAKLQFKTNALMNSTKYELHDLVVDTFEEDSLVKVSGSAVYQVIEKAYIGDAVLKTEVELLPVGRKLLFISADHVNASFEYSLDGELTWYTININEVKDITNIEGNSLVLRVTLPDASSSITALSYAWA